MVKCVYNRDWPNSGPTCAMGENFYYVYLEVNIVIIVYMDLEFGYMDIYGLLGRGFPHEKGVVVQFISVITLEDVLHTHTSLCVSWFYHAIYITGFIKISIRVFWRKLVISSLWFYSFQSHSFSRSNLLIYISLYIGSLCFTTFRSTLNKL